MKKFKVTDTDTSLSEVHSSVDMTIPRPFWKRMMAFFGPAYLVSVGYMDPGNWATDLAGGSKFGYSLIWVLLMSNIMALLLQSLSARLGIVRGRDLAQANRELYPKSLNFILYLFAEIAIAATDLAEVLGMAIGLHLLTGLPLIWGVVITVLDTFLLLYLQKLGMRKMEAFIIALVGIIGISFFIEIYLAKPDIGELAIGFIPTIPNNEALFIAIGIIGATVMPHNLYLHSALVQTRKIQRDPVSIKKAIKYNIIDSAIALNLAFFVNAAILVLAAAVFYKTGRTDVAEIKEAHQLLAPLLGTKVAPILFAVALIAAGQSSTITGTMAGQIVMEGYLRLRINPILRRLITRLLAIIPALIVILIYGDNQLDPLLVLSQVILSIQLGFAVIPLIHFVSDKKTMGEFAIKTLTKSFAWVITGVLVYLNLKMVFEETKIYFYESDNEFMKFLIGLGGTLFVVMLIITFAYPLLSKRKIQSSVSIHPKVEDISLFQEPSFNNIAVALDLSANDAKIISFALGQGGKKANYMLIHVVESVTAKILKEESYDHETREDIAKIEAYSKQMSQMGYKSRPLLGFSSPAQEIKRIVEEENADLLVMGSHGHKGIKDFLYGETVEKVRHELKIPVLIVNV